MSNKDNVIRSELLFLFNKGKSEKEAYEEVSQTHGSHLASFGVVNKWYKAFRLGEDTNCIKKKKQKPRATDEFLINLVNENPDLNLKELAELGNISAQTVSNRLKQINADEEVVKYNFKTHNRGAKKLSNESLINLVNENPGLNMSELARLAGISSQNLSKRLKKINIDGESGYSRVNADKKGAASLTDELLIKIINENPDLTIEELAELTNTTYGIISYRIKRINRDGDRVKFNKKGKSKITDESLINLVNSNPDLNMEELSKLIGTRAETLSKRMKEINRDGELIKYSKKGSQNGATKFSDEFLINLIKDNPGLNMKELAKLAGTSQPTISNRLRKINSNRSDDDKISIQRISSSPRSRKNSISQEYLTNLVNDNPNLNISELAEIADTSVCTIWNKIKKVNNNGETINYKPKKEKFTDEFLINLINENPELNMRELAKLAGAVPATILNRINKINSNEQVVNYNKKEFSGRNKAFTDEFLIKLVSDNPGLSMMKLAKLANVATSTISNRLKELNMKGERVPYTIKKRSNNSRSTNS